MLSQSSTYGGASSGGSFAFCRNADSGEAISLSHEDMERGLVIGGIMGAGKTYLIGKLLDELAAKQQGFLFLDVHNDATDDFLRRVPPSREKDIILLSVNDPGCAPGINLLQPVRTSDLQHISFTINAVLDLFSKLFFDGQDLMHTQVYMAELLQCSIPVMLAQSSPMTLAELPLLLTNQPVRDKLLTNLTNSHVRSFWERFTTLSKKDQDERTAPLLRRLDNLLIDPLIRDVISQPSTFSMRTIMDEAKIVLVKLSRNLPTVTKLVGGLLVMEVARACFSRADTPREKRVHFTLIADEFQNFASHVFLQLLTEGRKYALSTVVAFQSLGQLPEPVQVGVHAAANMIIYQVSGEDAATFSREFALSPLSQTETVSANVISTLLQDNHPSSAVQHFVSRWLRLLQKYRGTEDERVFLNRAEGYETYLPTIRATAKSLPGTALYAFSQDNVAQGMIKLGDWVFSRLTDPKLSSTIDDYAVLSLLGNALGFSNYVRLLYDPPKDLYTRPGVAAVAQISLSKGTLFELVSSMAIGDLLQNQQAAHSTGFYEAQYASHHFGYEGSLGTMEERSQAATAIFFMEKDEFFAFQYDLKLAVEELRKVPPVTNKYGGGVNTSVADREKQLAKLLSNPPRYTAYARLGEWQGRIQALPLAQPIASSDLVGSRLRASNIASGYIRRREDIQRELEQRARQLQPSPGFLPALPSPSSLTPAQPFSQPGIYAIEEEFEPGMVVESVPTYSKEEELYRQRYYAVNGCFPSYLPMSETPEQKRIRLFIAMNGFPPPASLVSKWGLSQTKGTSGAAHPATPPKSAKQKSPGTQHPPAKRKRTRQDEEE